MTIQADAVTIAKYDSKEGLFEAGEWIMLVEGVWQKSELTAIAYSGKTVIKETTDPEWAMFEAKEYTDGRIGGEFVRVLFGYKKERKVDSKKLYDKLVLARHRAGFVKANSYEDNYLYATRGGGIEEFRHRWGHG